MRTIATKQPTRESVKPKKSGARSRAISPLSTGMPLLQRKCACGGGCPRCKEELGIQTKLKIGEPGDKYEQEADRIADMVMRMPDSSPDLQSTLISPVDKQSGLSETLQRLAADKSPSLEDAIVIEEGIEQGIVQIWRSSSQKTGTPEISPELLNRAQGGEPLSANVQRFMETRFGADFSQIQIHSNHQAASLSRAFNARAFTYGQHIYFGQGEYQPETQEGKRVLAHELTHAIQQGGAQSQLPLQQKATANAPTAIQRLSPLGSAVQHNVAPWGSGPRGADYEVTTDAGSTVTAWEAYFVYQDRFRYWCHGHSLDSYSNYDYSVYSGPPMATVIRDEWTNIPPDQTQAGDIAVWTASFDHSAKFTKPVIKNGQLVPDRSELSTKNGQNALTRMSLASIAAIYGSQGIAIFRHR